MCIRDRLWNCHGERIIVHIDSIPAEIDNHYQPVVELIGNVGATLRTLTDGLAGLTLTTSYQAEIAAQRNELADIDIAAQHHQPDGAALDPVAVVLRLREELSDDATVACDVGSNYIYMARHFRVYEPRRLLFSNGQQTLGVALPWAMAACPVSYTHLCSAPTDTGCCNSRPTAL